MLRHTIGRFYVIVYNNYLYKKFNITLSELQPTFCRLLERFTHLK